MLEGVDGQGTFCRRPPWKWARLPKISFSYVFPAPTGKASFAAIQMKQATLPQQPSIERRVFCVSEKQMRSSTRSDRQDRLLRRAMPDRIAKVGCAPLGSCYHQLYVKSFLVFSFVRTMSGIGNTLLPTISTYNIQ